MDRMNLIKFILISLALPAQYFISKHWSNDNIQQSIALKNIVQQMNDFKVNYLELESWKKWYINMVVDNPRPFKTSTRGQQPKRSHLSKRGDLNDDVALEVLQYRKNLIDFGESSVVRAPRPSKVLFRVGQVIKHKRFDVVGVIIGWDETAQAPHNWLTRNYFDEEQREVYVNQPHYLILVDEKYQNVYSSKAYIAQDDIEVIVNNQVKHQTLHSYFESYDGGQYLKKRYLNTVYPHD